MSILSVKNLSFSLSGADNLILDDISFNLETGQSLTIVGPNGCGKSTLVNCLVGYISNYVGSIFVDSKDLKSYPPRRMNSIIRLLGQDPSSYVFSDLTMRENLILAGRSYGEFPSDFKSYLDSIRPALSEHLDKRASSLSGGERQALALAMVLLNPPKILVFDEHTSALDKRNADHVLAATKKLIGRFNVATITITHQISDIVHARGKILIMSKGKIVRFIEPGALKGLTQGEMLATCYQVTSS